MLRSGFMYLSPALMLVTNKLRRFAFPLMAAMAERACH